MLEWYRVDESYEQLMQDCVDLIALAAETVGTKHFAYGSKTVDPSPNPSGSLWQMPSRVMTSTFWRRSKRMAPRTATPLASQLVAVGMRVAADDTWADLFSRVIVEKVEAQSRQRSRDDPRPLSHC